MIAHFYNLFFISYSLFRTYHGRRCRTSGILSACRFLLLFLSRTDRQQSLLPCRCLRRHRRRYRCCRHGPSGVLFPRGRLSRDSLPSQKHSYLSSRGGRPKCLPPPEEQSLCRRRAPISSSRQDRRGRRGTSRR